LELGSLLSLIVGILSTQTYIQAVYAASDTKTARTGSLVAAAMTIPVGLPSVLVGMYMSLYYPGITPIDALPLFIINNLPDWLGGLAIGGLILSTIGSAAGLALGIGTMLSRDIVSGVFHYTNDLGLLWVNRSIVLLIAFIATFFAFSNMNSLVLDWGILSMSLRGSSIILPLSFAIFFPGKLSPRWAIISMLIGAVIALLTKLFYPSGLDPLFASLLASMVVILFGVIKNTQKHLNTLEQKM
jgi:SSS family solute:Na+ symporter